MTNDLDDGSVFARGSFYEDCAFHPVLCTDVYDDGSIGGISLIDGSSPRNCSLAHCDPHLLTLDEATEIKKTFRAHLVRRTAELAAEARARV